MIADVLAEQLPLQNAHDSVIITFDDKGVSSHPNHISLNDGAKAFMRRMNAAMKNYSSKSPKRSSITLYALRSTNMLRKYISVFDAPMTLVNHVISGKHTEAVSPTSLLFIGDLPDYRIAQKAMTTAHKSQMVWFRWGWIGVSRYMVMNDLVKGEVL